MDDIVRLVIALARELADQARAGEIDPALLRRTKVAVQRLYQGLQFLPPPLRVRAQRIVRDAVTIVQSVERQFGPAPAGRPAPAPPPVPPAAAVPQPPKPPPPVVPAEPASVAPAPPQALPVAVDPASVRAGVVWAAILGTPRGLDTGW
ncbi:hypothetical protein EPN52_09425 [bacterium]|nr:MAG: hypothetical protein EPN52_09425 [bacterium]